MTTDDRTPILVTTTADNRDTLSAIAAALVQARLAACCQIGGPVTSTYRWNGTIETADEYVCTIKTVLGRYAAVEQCIRERHSYDEPEIIWNRVEGGSATWLEWLQREVH